MELSCKPPVFIQADFFEFPVYQSNRSAAMKKQTLKLLKLTIKTVNYQIFSTL